MAPLCARVCVCVLLRVQTKETHFRDISPAVKRPQFQVKTESQILEDSNLEKRKRTQNKEERGLIRWQSRGYLLALRAEQLTGNGILTSFLLA